MPYSMDVDNPNVVTIGLVVGLVLFSAIGVLAGVIHHMRQRRAEKMRDVRDFHRWVGTLRIENGMYICY